MIFAKFQNVSLKFFISRVKLAQKRQMYCKKKLERRREKTELAWDENKNGQSIQRSLPGGAALEFLRIFLLEWAACCVQNSVCKYIFACSFEISVWLSLFYYCTFPLLHDCRASSVYLYRASWCVPVIAPVVELALFSCRIVVGSSYTFYVSSMF